MYGDAKILISLLVIITFLFINFILIYRLIYILFHVYLVRFVKKIKAPPSPSFKGIMAAKKKTIESKDLASVGAIVDGAWSLVADATPRPPRAAGIKVTDEGTGGTQLVSFLAEKKLI